MCIDDEFIDITNIKNPTIPDISTTTSELSNMKHITSRITFNNTIVIKIIGPKKNSQNHQKRLELPIIYVLQKICSKFRKWLELPIIFSVTNYFTKCVFGIQANGFSGGGGESFGCIKEQLPRFKIVKTAIQSKNGL